MQGCSVRKFSSSVLTELIVKTISYMLFKNMYIHIHICKHVDIQTNINLTKS